MAAPFMHHSSRWHPELPPRLQKIHDATRRDIEDPQCGEILARMATASNTHVYPITSEAAAASIYGAFGSQMQQVVGKGGGRVGQGGLRSSESNEDEAELPFLVKVAL